MLYPLCGPRRRSGSFAPAVLRWQSIGWIVGLGLLTALLTTAGFLSLLSIASALHSDIGSALAKRLARLAVPPPLAFAGDSRMLVQADPLLAARLLKNPLGSAVNIAIPGGSPMQFAAAARVRPDLFGDSVVILSVSPFVVNDGARAPLLYPSSVIARLRIGARLRTFLPGNIDTLVWFVRESFESAVPALASSRLNHTDAEGLGFQPAPPVSAGRWAATELQRHPYFRDWNPHGVKTPLMVQALCELRRRCRRLRVVVPPFTPLYSRGVNATFDARRDEFVRILDEAAGRCDFDVTAIDQVPGFTDAEFYDDNHLAAHAVPAYTRHLLEQLGYLAADPRPAQPAR